MEDASQNGLSGDALRSLAGIQASTSNRPARNQNTTFYIHGESSEEADADLDAEGEEGESDSESDSGSESEGEEEDEADDDGEEEDEVQFTEEDSMVEEALGGYERQYVYRPPADPPGVAYKDLPPFKLRTKQEALDAHTDCAQVNSPNAQPRPTKKEIADVERYTGMLRISKGLFLSISQSFP